MPNRLSDETSPYLLQHASNPVDWFPWGDEALTLAREQGRPILLSIGYSACHWCHVMERESFENPQIAAQMNAGFVNIKVDREERPDLDEVYMRAVQAFNGGQGGWPMTVFLTPEGQPFWGGTYFPPETRGRMPGFGEVLSEMLRLFQEHPDEVGRITAEMQAHLDRTSRMPVDPDALATDWLERVASAHAQLFDRDNGGFGTQPKFPSHGPLAALLAHHHVTGAGASLNMVRRTLDAMAMGGVYDALAGGFARYSVDASWTVPHFEKMLYDNAQLLPIYADAAVVTGDPHYARIATETADWILGELRLEHGGFAASLDADTEGVEGRFYVWTLAEATEVLGADQRDRIEALLGVSEAGSFEHGTSVIRLQTPLERLDDADRAWVEAALPALKAARAERSAPARDDKVVTAWNGLAISALARAGAALNRTAYVEAAAACAELLLGPVTVDGRLMRTYKDGRAHLPAYADDHAAVLLGLLDLYEATFDQLWLSRANELASTLVERFWDADGGGLFYTGDDVPALVTRSKSLQGGAEPAANALAALAFVRLGKLSGRQDLWDHAEVILRGYQPTLKRLPVALGIEAIAGHWYTTGGHQLGLVGSAEGVAPLLNTRRERYAPFLVTAVRRKNDPYTFLPWMLGKSPKRGATAFLCRDGACQLPATEPDALAEQMDAAFAPPADVEPTIRVRAPAWSTDPADWLNAQDPPSLASLRGQVVVLDFWTYCCINCLHVLPELAEVERRFAGQPVHVIGVHSAKFTAEQDGANVLAAMTRYGVAHPVLLDGGLETWSQYAVRSWPTVVLIDPTGRVAATLPGEIGADALTTQIQALLDEGAAAGTLSEGQAVHTPLSGPEAGLAFPGKVSVYPRSTGAEPTEASSGWAYISDSGNGRIVEVHFQTGEDGWPEVQGTRVFDGLQDPQGTCRYGDRLYVAETGAHRLLAIDLVTGDIEVLAGTGRLGRGGTIAPEQPTETALRSPWAVEVSGEGDDHVVLVAMAGTHQIWVYIPSQQRIGPLAGSGREDHIDGPLAEAALAQPSGLALYGPYLFFADSEISSVRAVDLQQREVVTVVGQGLFDFGDVDGSGHEVRLQHPLGVAATDNTVYVADSYNHKIKAIALHENRATTLAGGDGQLWEPSGLDAWGAFLWVADTNHHRIVCVHRTTGELRPVAIDLG